MERQWPGPYSSCLELLALAQQGQPGQTDRRSPGREQAPVASVRARQGPESSAPSGQTDRRSRAEALLAPERCASAAGQGAYQQRDPPAAVAGDCSAVREAEQVPAGLRPAADGPGAPLQPARALRMDQRALVAGPWASVSWGRESERPR